MFARTDRLLLRPGWGEDAVALYAAIAEEAIVRNLSSAPWPYTLADAEAFLATEPSAAEPRMLIFRRTLDAPELAGAIGFGRQPEGGIEFGYWIARRFWGRGYATEAGKAVIAIARDSLRLRHLDAGHFVDNPASGRVLEKLGFRPTGTIARRYSAGRRDTAACRQFRLDLTEAAPGARAALDGCMEMIAA